MTQLLSDSDIYGIVDNFTSPQTSQTQFDFSNSSASAAATSASITVSSGYNDMTAGWYHYTPNYWNTWYTGISWSERQHIELAAWIQGYTAAKPKLSQKDLAAIRKQITKAVG